MVFSGPSEVSSLTQSETINRLETIFWGTRVKLVEDQGWGLKVRNVQIGTSNSIAIPIPGMLGGTDENMVPMVFSDKIKDYFISKGAISERELGWGIAWVAAHEFGHSVGLLHRNEPGLVMTTYNPVEVMLGPIRWD